MRMVDLVSYPSQALKRGPTSTAYYIHTRADSSILKRIKTQKTAYFAVDYIDYNM